MDDMVQESLEKSEFCFRRACEQIVFLNKKLTELKFRYNRAQSDNNKAFRYSIRLKISAAEGIRNAYYEYACIKADEVTALRYQVQGSQLPDVEDRSDADADNDEFVEDGELVEEDGGFVEDIVDNNIGQEEDMAVDEPNDPNN